ncbi:hypothetical protein OIU84_009770 [Salix udensis]|uniref:F-box domain-containing protein n=1 Tax=Salix udensis TaxID=889485 RepID=A0AAD6JJ75_9ROSI|nr:hypothetical protein OIU84_009770 [Salix udensis]
MAVKSVGEEGMSLSVLPEGCIAKVLSFTGPTDACRLSIVSSMFKSAEESDAVWERFLPRDYQSIIFTSDSSVLLASLSSKKELYLRLCEKPIIIDDGKKSFSLVKKSGKKCYMLSARDLMIVWGDTPSYWRWNSDSSSRFGEVAELISVCWLEIRGTNLCNYAISRNNVRSIPRVQANRRSSRAGLPASGGWGGACR